jgi:uncharacterized protein YdeI (YjbR/CyaY-like superfamily)
MENLLFFENAQLFREWFAQHHHQASELWVGYYKKASKKPSMTWSESVDQALCYGWIDGIRKSIDDESYKIRFTPRRINSVWSAVNLKKMKELLAQGLMEAPGLAIYEQRKPENELTETKLSEAYRAKFEANTEAWAFFSKSAPSYQRQMIWWVMKAKKEATQLRRLDKLMEYSTMGKKMV